MPDTRVDGPALPPGKVKGHQVVKYDKSKAKPVEEVVAERDANREVWRNADGSRTLKQFSEPKYFKAASGAWEPIASEVVADGPGRFRNKANDWTVAFSPVDGKGGGGVDITIDGQSFGFTPKDGSASTPTVGTGDRANVVTYAEVWPGVDVRYTVRADRVKEDVIIKRRTGKAAYDFATRGVTAEDDPTTPGGLVVAETKNKNRKVRIARPEVMNKDGKPLGEAKPKQKSKKKGEITLDVDAAWLGTVADADFPIVLDPSTYLTPSYASSFPSWGNACGVGSCFTRMGNAPYGSMDIFWRSVVGFPYESLIDNNQNVLNAGLHLRRVSGQANPTEVDVYWANAASYAGAAGSGAPIVNTHQFGDAVDIDVSPFYGDLVDSKTRGAALGIVGDEWAGNYTFKEFTAELSILYNNRPTMPAQSTGVPADKAVVATTTPTISVGAATDTRDNQTVTHQFRITSSPDSESGTILNSGWMHGTTWTVPKGSLQNGTTYYWHLYAYDGQSITKTTWANQFSVDLRLGAGKLSPMDTMGPVSVNLATGNVTTTVSTPTVKTVGGELGVSLTYNSQEPARNGLRGRYWHDGNNNRTYDDGQPILERTDSQLAMYWGEGSPSPVMPNDKFLVAWDGYISVPVPGNYWLGANSDDGYRILLDGNVVMDRWNVTPAFGHQFSNTIYFPDTKPRKLTVHYFEDLGASFFELWARDLNGHEQVIPSSWLTPTAPTMPQGWTMSATDAEEAYASVRFNSNSVTLVTSDLQTVEYQKVEGALKPPPGYDDIVMWTADGGIQVFADDGRTYTFASTGKLSSIVSAADDRRPAATEFNVDAATGRVASLEDPVSGHKVLLQYGDSPECAAQPLPGGFKRAAANHLCRVDLGNGTATLLWYSGAGTDPCNEANCQLARVVNPGSEVDDFHYDGSGRLTKVRDSLAADAVVAAAPNNRANDDTTRTLISYVSATDHRVSRVTGPAPLAGAPRPERTIAYGPGFTDVGIAGSVGLDGATASDLMRYEYDSAGRTTKVMDNTRRVTGTTEYLPNDLVKATTNAEGLKSTTIYDHADRPIAEYGPAPASSFGADGKPVAAQAAAVPVTTNAYDEGILGLAATYWKNHEMTGAPLFHGTGIGTADGTVFMDWGHGSPSADLPNDSWSVLLTGEIVLKGAGANELVLRTHSGVRMWFDDKLVIDKWGDYGDTWQSYSYNVSEAEAGKRHKIRIAVRDSAGVASVALHNVLGTSPGLVAGTSLFPRYGLKTSTNDNGKKTKYEYSNAQGIGPHHGLVTAATVDPGGLNLTTRTVYEAPMGASEATNVEPRYLRPTATILPGGEPTRTTKENYARGMTASNACTNNQAIPQGGRLKFDTSADPDGAGPQQAIKRETVYDAVGRIVGSRQVAPVLESTWTCTTYDARGRTSNVSYPAKGSTLARTVTNNYSVGGDPTVTSVTDAAGTITTKVDLLGRVIEYTDVWGKKTTTSYNQAGYVTTKAMGGQTLAYTMDAAGRVKSVRHNNLLLAQVAHHPTTGRMTDVTYPAGSGNAGNGTKGTFGIDTWGRPNTVQWRRTDAAQTILTTDEVSRSIDGDVIDQKVDGVDPHTAGANFVYDQAGRLTQARVLGGRAYTYGYAASASCPGGLATTASNGNRTSMTYTQGTTTTTTSYCYDNADRLLATTPTTVAGTIAYDDRGNTTSIFGETHTYDIADRHLTTVKGATTVAYTRDALDRIVERKVNGAVVARYSSGDSDDSPNFTLDAANAIVEGQYQLPGGAMLTTRAAGNVWSYPNIHGDVVAVADQSGVKQGATRVYDPYGGSAAGGVPDNSAGSMDYGWLGQHQRPLEQQQGFQPIIEMGARQYSPLLGRFLEVDPVEGGSANDYDYSNNDPVNTFDLDGRAPGQPGTKCNGGYSGNRCITNGRARQPTARELKQRAAANRAAAQRRAEERANQQRAKRRKGGGQKCYPSNYCNGGDVPASFGKCAKGIGGGITGGAVGNAGHRAYLRYGWRALSGASKVSGPWGWAFAIVVGCVVGQVF